MHDANVVLLGSTKSSAKEISNHSGVIAAGLAVRLKSDDTLSIALADGSLLGISAGRSLSDTQRSAIVRKGLGVPVLLTAAFTPVVGAPVYISDTTGKAIASGGGATLVNATYQTSTKTAIDEDGATVTDGCALIDFQGGL